jgi:hypothetical protein
MTPDRDVRFTVLGPPVGYVAKATRGHEPAKKYWAYGEKVRLYALQAGLRLPLEATEQKPICVHVLCFFDTRRHCDPENCCKGIKDFLFYKSRNGDKFTGGSHAPPFYGDAPRVEVTVEFWDMKALKGAIL